MVKNPSAKQKILVQSLSQEDHLEKGMATHSSILFFFYSSILAWEIPWTEEPGRLQTMGSQKRRDLVIKTREREREREIY